MPFRNLFTGQSSFLWWWWW